MPGMRAGRLVSNSGRAVSLGSRSSSLTRLRNWVQNRPGPAVIEPSDRISRLPYQKIAMVHSRPVLPHDAVGQELLPPVAYAPVLAAGQLVERCHEPAEVAARSSCGAFQPLVPNRTERQRICWPTAGPALLAGRLRARSGRVAAS